MKFFVITLAIIASSTCAFSPPAFTMMALGSQHSTKLFSEPQGDNEEEDGGLDLNLEEMFDMFDAADKGTDFDDAVQDIKKSN
mmetsp:Transcript_4986/g.6068  ORF Transcript_4986/g.6068 Transcript_4986/m.6068 type:complete len:83 (+) Transcript_4986:99-347(+)